jgi:hypothetical protein
MNIDLICLQNILRVFIENGVHSAVTNDGDTVLFECTQFDVPYKDALIDAGATFDLSYGCWVYWSMEK